MKTRQMPIFLNDFGVVVKRRKKNSKIVSQKKVERLHKIRGRIGGTIGRIVEKIVEMKELIEARIGEMRDQTGGRIEETSVLIVSRIVETNE